MSKAEIDGIAQDNILRTNATSSNALKVEMWKYENSVKLMSDAVEAWNKTKMTVPYASLAGKDLEKAKEIFITDYVDTVTDGVFNNIFNMGGRGPQTSGNEVTRDFTAIDPQ